jgi:hypothetical protein
VPLIGPNNGKKPRIKELHNGNKDSLTDNVIPDATCAAAGAKRRCAFTVPNQDSAKPARDSPSGVIEPTERRFSEQQPQEHPDLSRSAGVKSDFLP